MKAETHEKSEISLEDYFNGRREVVYKSEQNSVLVGANLAPANFL